MSRPRAKKKSGRTPGATHPKLPEALERAATLRHEGEAKSNAEGAEMAAEEFGLRGAADKLAEYMQPSKIPRWATPLTRELLAKMKDGMAPKSGENGEN